jgi:oligopeptide/dipeptide ABC transporter ATP-binding protein
MAALIGAGLGVLLGTIAVTLPPILRRLALRLLDITIAFPALLLALLLSAMFGYGETALVLAVGLALTPAFARTASATALSIAGLEFMTALRMIGVSRWRAALRHLLPNVSDSLIVLSSVAMVNSLIAISSLDFLGIGIQPPATDWGTMLSNGVQNMFTAPVVPIGPAAAILVTGIVITFLGESAAQASNPERRRQKTVEAMPLEGVGQDNLEANFAEDARAQPPEDSCLSIRNLNVVYRGHEAVEAAVKGVSFDLPQGAAIGIVGESGSGKSSVALAIAGLLPLNAAVHADRISLDGADIAASRNHGRSDVRALSMAVMFQDPSNSFNPALRLGSQLTEALRYHRRQSRRSSLADAVRALHDVKIDAPQKRLRQFPHELSGGMQQRAMLAMGMLGNPRLLIADEPTTALDVTVQASVMRLLQQLREERNIAILLISHDLSVIATLCDEVLVMYRGIVVETGPTSQVLSTPLHPYTRSLVSAIPRLDMAEDDILVGLSDVASEDRSGPGCPFFSRCAQGEQRCIDWNPVLLQVSTKRQVACLAIDGVNAGEVDASAH